MLRDHRSALKKYLLPALLLISSVLLLRTSVSAQQRGGRIEIKSSEMENAPNIVLRAFAVDENGQPIRLQADNITILHNGELVDDVRVIGDYQAGTFTIFVVDVPSGLEAKLQPIQDAIEEYTSPDFMEENADYVALFRVGATGPEQLLIPSNFFNSVRNYFAATPLTAATEQTALADSVGSLMSQIPALIPKGDMATSIVLITDGTDAVSKDFELENLSAVASSLDIPVHTIWIQNDEILASTRDEGREFLTQLASETNGLSGSLEDPESLKPIWDRIGAYRNHQVIEYTPHNLLAGDNEVTLSLSDRPLLLDATVVKVSESAPSVEILLPPESREITLESLEEPVRLSFSTTVSWLDDILREVVSAELLINEVPVQEIPAGELDQFTAEISVFSYGPNEIQVKIEDELGQIATSPAIPLMISEGDQFIPEEMRPSGLIDSPLFRIGLLCSAMLIVLAVVGLAMTSLRQYRRLREPSGPPDLPYAAAGSPGSIPEQDAVGMRPPPHGSPRLEVIASVTRMPPLIPLSAEVHRLGRSPLQADIVFENDITVSRLHASIALEGKDYRIYDAGSSSGTWVNNQPVLEYGHELVDGDEIRLGDTILRYHL